MTISAKRILFCLFSILIFNQTAHASLLLEPYLGYVFSGKIKGSSSANYSGSEYGARIGFSQLGFGIGVDYFAQTLKDDSNPLNNDLKTGDLGLFVAFKFPVLVRVYATYVPSPEMKSSNSSSSSTLKSGNLLKLGVGFTGLPFVNVNLEYHSGTYGTLNASGADFSLNPTVTTSALALSVSAPFELL